MIRLSVECQATDVTATIDDHVVESVVLHRRRAPKQEWVDVERNALVKEGYREVRIFLCKDDAVIVSKSRGDEHLSIVQLARE